MQLFCMISFGELTFYQVKDCIILTQYNLEKNENILAYFENKSKIYGHKYVNKVFYRSWNDLY